MSFDKKAWSADYNPQWRQENKDRVKEYAAKYHSEHKEKAHQANKAWREKNRPPKGPSTKPHGGRFIDRTGQRVGKLTIISFHSKTKWGSKWTCRCDCGSEIIALAGNIRPNHTTSCGCVQAAITTARNLKHGRSNAKEYESWTGAKARTTNPKHKRYSYYGGRGIKMCDRWLHSFENFFADMGECPPDKSSLGRIDNDGDYCPENCRWEDQVQQMNNTRRRYRVVTS